MGAGSGKLPIRSYWRRYGSFVGNTRTPFLPFALKLKKVPIARHWLTRDYRFPRHSFFCTCNTTGLAAISVPFFSFFATTTIGSDIGSTQRSA